MGTSMEPAVRTAQRGSGRPGRGRRREISAGHARRTTPARLRHRLGRRRSRSRNGRAVPFCRARRFPPATFSRRPAHALEPRGRPLALDVLLADVARPLPDRPQHQVLPPAVERVAVDVPHVEFPVFHAHDRPPQRHGQFLAGRPLAARQRDKTPPPLIRAQLQVRPSKSGRRRRR